MTNIEKTLIETRNFLQDLLDNTDNKTCLDTCARINLEHRIACINIITSGYKRIETIISKTTTRVK